MSEGFREAEERRNWLERLGDKIPGFRGFQDRELRREVDKMQREHLAKRIDRLKIAARSKARGFTDRGMLGELDSFDRVDRKLDGLGQAIRFADYGVSGFFDAVKIGEEELERLYQFDLSLLDDLERLDGELSALPRPGEGSPREALVEALERLRSLEDKWAGRKTVISQVVVTEPSAG